MATSKVGYKNGLDNLMAMRSSSVMSHDGDKEHPCPEVVEMCLDTSCRGKPRWGWVPPSPPNGVACQEHLVGHYVIQNTGLDGSSLVHSRTGLLKFLTQKTCEFSFSAP